MEQLDRIKLLLGETYSDDIRNLQLNEYIKIARHDMVDSGVDEKHLDNADDAIYIYISNLLNPTPIKEKQYISKISKLRWK